ncbi:MAG: TraR/DksA C4-type zinc finger protein, partial [Phycisphaerales bacterium]
AARPPPTPGVPGGTPGAPRPAAAAAGKPGAPPPKIDPKSASGRKGITIVTPKPVKRPSKASLLKIPALGAALFRPGAPAPRPLIQSGPKAPARGSGLEDSGKPRKTPFDKKTLDRFRQVLLRKRAELVGDVSNLETEALQGQSGALSHLPQHMAEQGSDAAGQSLSLDLAAADRRLIKEIDDALQRIADGTYGVCELTGKPIKVERLEELPWARYSIEAARELERRSVMP